MGLFGRKQRETDERIEALREELAALRERLETTDAAKSRLEENIGTLHAENGRLRDELLVQITTATAAANDATRTLAEQTASHLEEQRARLADLAVVATDAAEQASEANRSIEERITTANDDDGGDTSERLAALEIGAVEVAGRADAAEQRAAEVERRAAEAAERAAVVEQQAAEAAERAEAVERAAAELDTRLSERVGGVDERLTQVAIELANQLTELSNDIDTAATSSAPSDGSAAELDPELIEELLEAQDRLANEQARYQIAFRQDLAELADRLRRQR